MATYFLSDLHLLAENTNHYFRDEVEGVRLARFLEELPRTDPAPRVVFVGDVFDLTAMERPAGVEAFFSELDAPMDGVVPERTLEEKIAALQVRQPRFFRAVSRFAERHPTVYLFGNHDAQLAEAERPDLLTGLESVRFSWSWHGQEFHRALSAVHGHAWDESNNTEKGWKNRGAAFTSVVQGAALPYLRWTLATRGIDVDRLGVLRPEELVVPVLRRWLPPGHFERFFDAFLALLVTNGIIPSLASYFLTPDTIRGRLRDDDQLWENVGTHALEVLAGEEMLADRPPPPHVLVAGHTHVLDWARHEGRPGSVRLYCNLGTWTQKCTNAISRPETLMPVLRVGEEAGEVTAVLRDLKSGEELERAKL